MRHPPYPNPAHANTCVFSKVHVPPEVYLTYPKNRLKNHLNDHFLFKHAKSVRLAAGNVGGPPTSLLSPAHPPGDSPATYIRTYICTYVHSISLFIQKDSEWLGGNRMSMVFDDIYIIIAFIIIEWL